MRAGVRRAQVVELVDVIIDTGFTQHGADDVADADIGEGQAVGTSAMIHKVRRLATAGTRHELNHHGWMAGNVFSQVWNNRTGAPFADAAGRAAADERDGFALIKSGLAERLTGKDQGKNRAEEREADGTFHLSHNYLREGAWRLWKQTRWISVHVQAKNINSPVPFSIDR